MWTAMGLLLFSRKSSFHFIFMGLRESAFIGRKKIVVERGYCRNFGGVSSAIVLDDSDSCSNGESSREYEPIVLIIPRKRLHRCKASELWSVVVRVYKSLSWDVAREISFKRAMKRYGLFQSINAFKMFVHIFAYVGMQMEVYALLKDIVFYFQKAKFDLSKLFPHLLSSPNDAKISALVVDVLIKVLAANKMLENGIEAYFQAKKLGFKLSNFSCNFLLKCLAEASRGELLQTLFEEMKQFGPSPTVYTYTIMMNFYCCKNRTQHEVDIEKAANIMEEMVTRGISPSVVTHSVYIHGLCRVGRVGIALDFIRDLRHENQPLNSYCYNAVIHGFCAQGEVVEAMSLFEEMKSCGVPPDIYSYSILIDGFSKCGNVEKGLCLIKEMEASNIKPSLVSYSSLLNGLCRSGREISIDMFYELEESGYKYWVAYNILINRLYLQGDLFSAQKLLEEMISNNLTPDASSYKKLIHAFLKIGSTPKALELLNTMIKEGFPADIFTFNSIINGYCSEGHIMEVLQLIDELRDLGVTPNLHTYNAVINRLCKEGNSKGALEVIPLMLKMNVMPGVVNYSTLINGFAKQFNFKKAFLLYKGMLEVGVTPNTTLYTIIINMFCMMGKVNEAYQLFRKMACKGEILPSVVTYTCLIDGFWKVNRINMVEMLIDEMNRQNVSPDTTLHTIIINKLCMMGEVSEAYEHFSEMACEGKILPSVVTYTCLIDGFCSVNRIDMVNMLLDEMSRQNVSLDTTLYTIIINNLCAMGEVNKAYERFSEMACKGLNPDNISYTSIIAGFCRFGDMKKALILFKEMVQREILPSVVTYKCLIDGFCKVNRIDMAKKLRGVMRRQNVSPDVDELRKVLF